MDVFVITRASRGPEPLRSGTIWQFRATGFYLTPARKSDLLTQTQIDQLLDHCLKTKPLEFAAGGWFVHTSGTPWSDPVLVSQLRTALIEGPASLGARMRPVRIPAPKTFAERVRLAWLVLTGRYPTFHTGWEALRNEANRSDKGAEARA
jgi:hypothetical protein